ncbi:XdhC family protein [Salinibacterium sp. G-O1]|uniref:XdhC family protein n=1 Tax=Salinibacterium sp. G-O1 TaxID=3046208 RepID=UPI0024B931AE|nr:XdhC/CoxI family protein [Salinibacterium sp. G-O1]MDJ0335809.1 XdhC family protein [Salinibacterium sp. G-O1]
MFDIAERILEAVDAGRTLAVATAISIDGSAPRTTGSSMAFDGETVIGSIAGGCVEGSVVETCDLVLQDGVARTVEFGVSDETAFNVGLTCGGQLRIHVQAVTPAIVAALRDRSPITSIICEGDDVEVFVEHPPIQRRMIIFGAMEFSAALAPAAAALGYRVTVCDPRPLFATSARFPTAEVVVSWPTDYLAATDVDEQTVICILSHDARFDAELVAMALELPVAYVGAMGSRNTHDRRVASLLERGVTESAMLRLHSPIGLDLGASTPGETALSVLAEVLAARTDSTALPLAVTTGAIHTVSRRVTA